MYKSFFFFFSQQEYEQLKADARAQGSGQREKMADVDRQLTSDRSKLDQMNSEKVGVLGARELSRWWCGDGKEMG